MKPYYEELKKLLVKNHGYDYDDQKQKLTFKLLFQTLDCTEFYHKVPKYFNSRESVSNVKLIKAAMMLW